MITIVQKQKDHECMKMSNDAINVFSSLGISIGHTCVFLS
jgi:hypothetical protein